MCAFVGYGRRKWFLEYPKTLNPKPVNLEALSNSSTQLDFFGHSAPFSGFLSIVRLVTSISYSNRIIFLAFGVIISMEILKEKREVIFSNPSMASTFISKPSLRPSHFALVH